MNKINIAWVNDYTPKGFIGGATISGSLMIKEGLNRGYNVEWVTPYDIKEISELDRFDFFILNNVSMFKLEHIQYIIDKKKYAKYEHDYSFCLYRNARCENCTEKCTSSSLNPFFSKMYSNSKLNIFFSPQQLNIYKKFFGETMRDAMIIPAPIEKGKFYNMNKKRPFKYIATGLIANHKGPEGILNYMDRIKEKCHFVGKAVNLNTMERIKISDHHYLGEVEYDKMCELLNNYENIVCNPQMPETFGLAAIEAYLCGCKMVKLSNYKYGFETCLGTLNGKTTTFDQLIELCYEAPTLFWKHIGDIL